MKRNVLIGIVVTILIIALAVFAGMKFGKKDETKPTNNNSVVESNIATPTLEPSVEPTPIEETPSPKPEVTPTAPATSTTPNFLNENISGYSAKQKEEYAKRIAKEFWKKTGTSTKVYYNIDNIEENGKYVISVRNQTTTEALIWYEIDINNKTCETIS